MNADIEVTNEASFQEWKARRRRWLDVEHNVITDLKQLSGWSILGFQRHKPGVVSFRAVRGEAMISGYGKDEVFASLQLPQ